MANSISNSDIKLVEHFVSCIRAKKLRAISGSFSPDFVFSSPRIKAFNFEQFCKLYEDWSSFVEVQNINIEQNGDRYVVDQLVQFVDNQRNFFEVSKRKMTVTISNHLIESVIVKFKYSSKMKTYMDSIYPIAEQYKP